MPNNTVKMIKHKLCCLLKKTKKSLKNVNKSIKQIPKRIDIFLSKSLRSKKRR